MKKEKSLLLAVGTSIAALAMAFTISSCSGDNGKDGAQGPAGPDGTGTNGTNGTSCTVTGTGPWTVTCGTASVEIKNGNPGTNCTMTKEAIITCGDMTVGICADGAYDPEESYCNMGTTTELPDCGKATGSIAVVGKYNPNTQYCEMTSATAIKISNHCGDLADGSNPNDYNDGGVGNGSYSANVYCQFTDETTGRVANFAATNAANGSTGEGVDFCTENSTSAGASATAGDKKKLNEDGWKGEYCGVLRVTDTRGGTLKVMKVSTDGCTIGATEYMPNKVVVSTNFSVNYTYLSTAWLGEFCQYTDATTGKIAKLSDGRAAYCLGATALAAPAITAEQLAKKINAGNWKGEYCGWADETVFKAGMATDDAVFKTYTIGASAGNVACEINAHDRSYGSGSAEWQYCSFANATATEPTATDKRCTENNGAVSAEAADGDEFNETEYTQFCMPSYDVSVTYALAEFCNGVADAIYGDDNSTSLFNAPHYCFQDVVATCTSEPANTDYLVESTCEPDQGGNCENDSGAEGDDYTGGGKACVEV